MLSGDIFSTDSSGSGIHFSKAFIPLTSHAKLESTDYTLNENGIPCCPHDTSLSMKPEGASKLRSGVIRYKFSCPKAKWTEILKLENTNSSVSAKIHVRIPPMDGWFI